MFSFLFKYKNWYFIRARNYEKNDVFLFSWLQNNYKIICKFELVYIYGTDSNSFKVHDYLIKLGINSEKLYFIENNPNKRLGLNAISINELNKSSHNCCVLMTSTLMDETVRQLKKAKIQNNQILIYKNNNTNKIKLIFSYICSEISYFKHSLSALILYSKLKSIYKNKRIYLCPYPGTGDILFTGDIFHLILEKDKVNKNEYVVLIGSNSCKSILEHFGINNIDVIPQNNIELLKYICSILPGDLTNISYLGFWGLNYQRLARLEYTSKLSFREFLHSLFLDCSQKDNLVKEIQFNKKPIIFDEVLGKSVELKKVIILAPVAGIEFNEGISLEFWENLASYLTNLGYFVYTNTNGKDFPVIKNTSKIFLNYDDFFYTLNECKALIGLRSGLFDIMNSADCKKIVLYPRRYSDNLFDFFSLNNNFKNINNCLEIKINDNSDEIFKLIAEELAHE